MQPKDYQSIADQLAADIAAGKLRPGDRLQPQREFAQARGIATSTASRAYKELVRRGLISGEVGRGSFVSLGRPATTPAGDAPLRIDLELNFPTLPEQGRLMAPALQNLLRRPEALALALRPVDAAGTREAREAAAGLMAQPDWAPEPAALLFAGNGKQAITAALSALLAPGDRLGVEALTYPLVKGIAQRLGLVLVPVAMDAQGLAPQALAQAHERHGLKAVYLQPSVHNPVGTTMPLARRRELGGLLQRLGLPAVEDAIYGFLAPGCAPIARFAPEHSIVVDSLSKRLAPGLTLGLVAAPARLRDAIALAIQSGGWGPGGVAVEVGTRWIADGTAAAIAQAKRADARARLALAREALQGLDLRFGEDAYHCWLSLPGGWNAEAFTAALAREGVAITPASAFVVEGPAPQAVRLAIGSPPLEALKTALALIARHARSGPTRWSTE